MTLMSLRSCYRHMVLLHPRLPRRLTWRRIHICNLDLAGAPSISPRSDHSPSSSLRSQCRPRRFVRSCRHRPWANITMPCYMQLDSAAPKLLPWRLMASSSLNPRTSAIWQSSRGEPIRRRSKASGPKSANLGEQKCLAHGSRAIHGAPFAALLWSCTGGVDGDGEAPVFVPSVAISFPIEPNCYLLSLNY